MAGESFLEQIPEDSFRAWLQSLPPDTLVGNPVAPCGCQLHYFVVATVDVRVLREYGVHSHRELHFNLSNAVAARTWTTIPIADWMMAYQARAVGMYGNREITAAEALVALVESSALVARFPALVSYA